jgi:indole-3-acetate monooxygenase
MSSTATYSAGCQAGSTETPIERARSIFQTVSDEAERSESLGQLSEPTLAALHHSGMFHLLVPKCYGGLEAGIVESLEVIELLCEADGSTGWVMMACNVAMGTAATFLPKAGADAVFGTQIPLIAGQGAPRGRAIVDGNGYRVTGRWSYGSGVLHAEYLHTGAMVYENNVAREALTFIVPIEHVKILGNWNVIGLRATGSVDYSLNDVYVPKEFTHSPNTFVPERGSDMYRLGIVGLSPIAHGAFAIGVGRHVLKELAVFASSSDALPGPLKDSPSRESFQEKYGAAEGKLRAGRAFMYEIYHEAENTILRGNPISTRQLSLMRLSLNTVTVAAAEACTFAYHIVGGAGLRDSVIQRCVRDMMAASQHRIVSDFMLRECAREILGWAKGKMWTSYGLIDPPQALADA